MTVPFALSIHNFVNSVGAYVGLASIVAVAILILLYFAHARETATLRERLDEAQQRIGGLEGRIGQLLQSSQRARAQAPAGVPGAVPPAPPPAGLRPVAAPGGSVRRVPSPATAAATTAPAVAAAAAAAQAGSAVPAPAAPAGTGAPALASATKLIPDVAVSGAPDDTIFVPAAAASNGAAAAERTAVLAAPAAVTPAPAGATPAPAGAAPVPAGATPAPVAATPAAASANPALAPANPALAPANPAPAPATSAAAAAAATASASPRGAATAPPRVQIAREPERGAATPATSAGGGGVRRIAGRPQSAVSLPAFEDEPAGRGRFTGRVLPLLIAVVAVAVIVAGLIVVINAGNGSTTGNHNASNQTGQSLHNQQAAPVKFNPAHVTVAVLNGTAQSGLAGDVGKKLGHDGYKQGNITNAASQTQSHTYVYFVARGRATKANRTAAQHVARVLKLSQFWVRKAGHTVLQSCTISAAGTSLGSCRANVIVSVGQNRVNLASG